MHILCPHCNNPIELVKVTPHEEINCPSCGSGFHLETGSTAAGTIPETRRMGRFDLLDMVGQGGFGTVYRARDAELDRTVALKVPRSGNLAGQQELDRFLREVRSVAQLRHGSIVAVHEVGQIDGVPYLVSEFVEGVTLGDWLSAHRPTQRQSAELIASVAEAVQYAHDQGVVHRDLKPTNIMLDGQNRPMVMDFGLAKRDAGEITMTLNGQILGTPAYMSPEQARGESHQVDGRSDVYSLGVILYELLTGELPFRGTKRMLLHQVLHDEPRSPRKLNDTIARDLETICLKAMAKEPVRRYSSARELSADLQRWLKGEPILARPVGRLERGWRWCKRNPAVASLSSLVFLLLVVGTSVGWVLAVRAQHNEQAALDEKERARGKEQEALREAAKAKKARDFLVSIFNLSDRKGESGTLTARQILDHADRRIAAEFADQPELRADLEAAIEEVYAAIGTSGPQAMILDARGTVRLESVREPKRQPVPQTLLYHDDRLVLGEDGDVRLVFLQDFHKERLKPGSEVTIRRKGSRPAEAVRERDDDNLLPFVRLPKGTFYMGGGGGKAGTKTEIKEDFEIGRYEVTQGEWQAVMRTTPSYYSRVSGGSNAVKDIPEDELKLFPVEQVSWDDVQEFLKKLNEKERERGYLYRLPTEAEWEYACRGGATSEEECSFHFYFDKPTNSLSSEQANFNGNYPFGDAPKGPYLGRSTRVGSYPPNRLGLCDMHGNVYEWCADLYAVGGSHGVDRGSGWGSTGDRCRAAYRDGFTPSGRNRGIGFRLARVPVR